MGTLGGAAADGGPIRPGRFPPLFFSEYMLDENALAVRGQTKGFANRTGSKVAWQARATHKKTIKKVVVQGYPPSSPPLAITAWASSAPGEGSDDRLTRCQSRDDNQSATPLRDGA
jgi:hypothetical protein